MTSRTLIIGDVHGCLFELKSLVQKLNYQRGRDQLIFVGDLINRGPDSLAVWLYYKQLGARSVLGNHELHLLQDAQGVEVHKDWIASFKVQFGGDYQAYLDDISTWPLYLETEDYLVVHGGLVPGEHPGQSDPNKVTGIRMDEESNRPWFDFYQEKKLVVFGHWAKLGGLERDNVIGLDTGCVYGGKLTALVLPGRERVSVEAKKAYCPINRGQRN